MENNNKAKKFIEKIYKKYFNAILAAVKAKFQLSTEDAQDIVQEMFTKLGEKIIGMDDEEFVVWEARIQTLIAYLTKNAFNVKYSEIDREKKRLTVNLNHKELYGFSEIETPEYFGDTSIIDLLRNGLTKRDFDVLMEKNIHDKQYVEIAREQSLGSARNARLVYHRARKKAKELLAS